MTAAAAISATGIHVFGVRHLSPAGAWHLRKFLDRVQPKAVLIEGLSDANSLIPDVTRKGTKPPIAILAYTDTLPARTLVYPLARYSPEYQALQWARENRVRVEFIDLPSAQFLGLQAAEEKRLQELYAASKSEDDKGGIDSEVDAETPGEESADDAASDSTTSPADEPEECPTGACSEQPVCEPVIRKNIYDQFAEQSGEPDYETYWERQFEHNLGEETYRLAAFEFGRSLRELEEDAPTRRAENLVREAYMRRRIADVMSEGVPAEKIVAIVGAYHAPVLFGFGGSGESLPAMTDEEFASIPKLSSKLTLMPYSYFRLSSQSGYGAGNNAPAYFEMLWGTVSEGKFPELPARYLGGAARLMREQGIHRSAAEVIEGVRLANTLSALKGGQAPTLRDLRDAAITLLGQGDLGTVREALVRLDVGTAIGELPEGVSQTSIQADFDRELKRLRLEKYKSAVRQEMTLDLRENRRASSEESAFLDLNRSSFFHRLRVLGVSFVVPTRVAQDSATWAERWVVQWSPESEMALVESVLLGETIPLAAAYKFKTLLEACTSIASAADIVMDTCQCRLMEAMEEARQRLQALASQSTDFAAIAHAARQLSTVVRYGDVRKFDPAPLYPLVEELFVEGALSLVAAANCDNQAAAGLLTAIDQLNQVSLEHHDRVDEQLWVDRLQILADADDRNPLLSGYACAVLLERGVMANEALGREVSRRLSPGIAADLGAGWFEGLAGRNRYSLLARQPLWEQLASYVHSLDDEQFRRAVVFLRRAFGSFSPQEKRHISENLGEAWALGKDEASEQLGTPLTEQEEQTLQDLNEFDFNDL